MTDSIPDTKPVTILLVDDDDVDVMGIKRALSKLRVINPLVRARDGIEGLELLRKSGQVPKPYLILLDINMPRMNGIKMLTELRNDPTLSDSVVFILTTSQADEDKISAYNLNVAGYILKKQVGDGFMKVVEMLDRYWKLVELPVDVR